MVYKPLKNIDSVAGLALGSLISPFLEALAGMLRDSSANAVTAKIIGSNLLLLCGRSIP